MTFQDRAYRTLVVSSSSKFLDNISQYLNDAQCSPISFANSITDAKRMSMENPFDFIIINSPLPDELGAKFQLIAYQPASADYEGVIGVWNDAAVGSTDADTDLLYWVTGAQAAVAVNKSLTNSAYNGELTIDTDYTQAELEAAIKAGKFMFHNVNGTVRVLEDINTLLTLTDEKGEIFQSNQTVRVCDQIANDVAVLFNTRYVGIVPNDGSGRATLWNDIVKLIKQLETIRAVEDFDTDTVEVAVGDHKGAVVLTINGLNIVNAMSQLYMSVIIQ